MNKPLFESDGCMVWSNGEASLGVLFRDVAKELDPECLPRYGERYDMACLLVNVQSVNLDASFGRIKAPVTHGDWVQAICTEFRANLAAFDAAPVALKQAILDQAEDFGIVSTGDRTWANS